MENPKENSASDDFEAQVRKNMNELGTRRLSQGLNPALRHLRHEAEDLAREQMKSRRDPLTGYLNRMGFEEKLMEEVKRSRRNGRPLSIILFDLNKLKQINDEKGHSAGDNLIKRAMTIIAGGREYDQAARWGGDEFAKLLPETDEKGAMQYWDRVNSEFQKEGISIVAGIVQVDTASEATISESWRLCDLAETEAKKRSKEQNGVNIALTPNDLTNEQILAA